MKISETSRKSQFDTIFGDLEAAFKNKLKERLGDFPAALAFYKSKTPPALEPVFFWHYLVSLMYDTETLKNAIYERLYMNMGVETETITKHIFEAIRNIVATQGIYAPPLSEYDGYFIYQGMLTSPELDVSVIDNFSIKLYKIYTRGFFMIAQSRSNWSFKLQKDGVIYIIPFAPVKIKLNGEYLVPDGRVYKVNGNANDEMQFEFYANEPFAFVWNVYNTTPSVTLEVRSEVNFTPIYPTSFTVTRDGDLYVYTFTAEYIDLPVLGVI